nr:NADH dehydrogenase subunit 4 [Oxypeltus quadrispinosus]
MKLLFLLLFLIPLSILSNFWMVQLWFFISSFLFLFMFSYNYLYLHMSYFLGLDLLSFSLVLLSFWICSLMIMASEKIFKDNNFFNLFLILMILLMVSLYLAFASMNLFVFYLFFEISLIPILMLIIGWGYQPERIEAGLYLLFYTLLASLPMMVAIFYYYNNNMTIEFAFMKQDYNNFFMYLCVNMVFFIKIPMFFVHLWLPKAHVEAPVSGSMILAGIMLKLGGYGLLRLMSLFLTIGMKINFLIITISLVGGFIVSLICIRQSDIKALIAYSSVAHMGLVLGGLLTLNMWGSWGALIMMIAHGLCSSGLFCLANFSYERLGSRSLYLNKGFLNIVPSISLWWFLLLSSNMAAPPSFNLLGEIFLINSLVSFSNYNMIYISLLSFFSAVYSLFLYSYSQHGAYYSGMYSIYSITLREYLLLLMHWLPLNILLLKGDFFFFLL